MTDTSANQVSGLDGIAPVYQPNSRWSQWKLKEIYLGQLGANKYVPNVEDWVIDTDTMVTYEVVSLDMSTMIPTMVKVNPIPDGVMTKEDILLGVGPGPQSTTFRIYLDNSVVPFTLTADGQLHVYGSMATKAKIFRGSDLTGDAHVVSGYYDQTGGVISDTIPLELVGRQGLQNTAIKSIPTCYTMENMPDGEVVVVVFYSDAGHVISKRQCLIENTPFIRSTDTSIKYVVGIALESPFLSHVDPLLLQYPINVPLNGMNIMGVVTYSDGSQLRMPVDGTKFVLFGLENYIATDVGQKFGLSLKYNLGPDEFALGANGVGNEKFISKIYKAITLQQDGVLGVKLFGYPVWIDAVNGYRLEWFLCNLDRSIMYRVTPYVTIAQNSRPFDPNGYGVTQALTVAINLHDVNGAFASYIHVQTITFVLTGHGDNHTTNWNVAFDPGQNPVYGPGVFATSTMINQNLWKLRVDSGFISQVEWLDNLYYRTKPLTDEQKEVAPPVPDFFALLIGDQRIEYPVSQWNIEQTINVAVPDAATLFVVFFKRMPDTDLDLAVAGLPIRQT